MCSFLTGWGDVALFVRYKTFATMMTGNVIWLAQALVQNNWNRVGYYTSVIVSYLAGITAFRKADLSLKQRTMPLCSILVAALFVLSEAIYLNGILPWLPICLLSFGWAIVNSVGTEVAGTLTFVLTGHMTKITHQFVDRLSADRKDLCATSLLQNATVLFGFSAGALWACALRRLFGTVPLEFPALGILYGLLFLWQDMESLGGAWWLRKDHYLCELDDDGGICLSN